MAPSTPLHLEGNLTGIELRKGHDGFLRGKPEPVLIWVALGLVPSGATLLQGSTRTLAVTGGYPFRVPINEPRLIAARAPGPCERFLLLGLAFEQDSGEDVRRLSTALANTFEWSVRAGDSRMAAPFRLHELALVPPGEPPDATSIRLSHRDVDLADACTHDDWIGAAMVLLPGDRGGITRWNVRFCSDDQRNDWWVQLTLRAS